MKYFQLIASVFLFIVNIIWLIDIVMKIFRRRKDQREIEARGLNIHDETVSEAEVTKQLNEFDIYQTKPVRIMLRIMLIVTILFILLMASLIWRA
jgi:hypothetical protein